jgi:transposase
MVQASYTAEFKKVAVQKYFSRGNRSLEDISTEIGAGKSTIYGWVQKHKKYAINTNMKDTAKRPQDWTADEKIQACFDYENLTTEQQGEFLRGKGLHSSRLSEWKKVCISALSSKDNDSASRGELNDAHRKIKELERDLLRKDRALAETTALLVLKKKADLIWGSEEPK